MIDKCKNIWYNLHYRTNIRNLIGYLINCVRIGNYSIKFLYNGLKQKIII